MGSRDRFLTTRTARAIVSWRPLLGVGVGVALAIAGLPVGVAIGVGVAICVATVGAALSDDADQTDRPAVDPFAIGEPWRHIIQRAQSTERKMHDTVARMPHGPLRATMTDIADQVGRGVEEAWAVACRGDEIDDAVRRLEPTALRSRLAAAEERTADEPSDDALAAVASLRRQLESAERLQRLADETAASLRRTQTQLDELVARASEMQIGSVDTDGYRREVDELVVRLQALHLAVEETREI